MRWSGRARWAAALWWRGGFPRSFTVEGDEASRVWRREFIRTVIERDLPQWGMNVAAPARTRFWSPGALARHPKSGASWEGFALDQALRIARPDEACF